MYCVKNEFNPTCEVQNIENGVFQNEVFCKTLFSLPQTSKVALKSLKYTVSKMSLIQPAKFRTWETGLFKMPHFETPVSK